jgi:hypothetical protein
MRVFLAVVLAVGLAGCASPEVGSAEPGPADALPTGTVEPQPAWTSCEAVGPSYLGRAGPALTALLNT